MHGKLVFGGLRLDRAARFRGDTDWLTRQRNIPDCRLLATWRDRSLIRYDGERPGPAVYGGATAARLLAEAEADAFLGVDGDGRPWFAADLSGLDADALAILADGGQAEDLGRLAPRLDAEGGAMLAYARALMHWHRHSRFCGCCGAPTRSEDGGHARLCTAEGCGLRQFPRTDPVVIMLVTRPGPGAAACLLARQPAWMTGLMSTLAGFVEPGESLEDAVRREVREETGIEAERIGYRSSQPWPFPCSLMLGFRVDAAAGAAIAYDPAELEDARWFTRAEVQEIKAMGLRLPYRGTIARALIEHWLAGDDPSA